jgi:hypothetical protein
MVKDAWSSHVFRFPSTVFKTRVAVAHVSAEVGELHNQAGLLLFMQGKVEEAAKHAEVWGKCGN